MNKYVEARIRSLEQELEQLRGKPVVYADFYSMANYKCTEYFESIRLPGQSDAAMKSGLKLARAAYSENHGIPAKRENLTRFICTKDDVEEYFYVFRLFVDHYKSYLENPAYGGTRWTN